ERLDLGAPVERSTPGSTATPGETTDVRIGPYLILEELGEGGAGTIYRVQHELLGTEHALKVLHDDLCAQRDMVDRFIQEARISSALQSPYVLQFTDFGWTRDGRAYAVMELLKGHSLRAYLDFEERASLPEAQAILLQVAEALRSAHAANVVHRDIKPDNLFLTTDAEGNGLVKVLDFGVARVRGAQHNAQETQVGD